MVILAVCDLPRAIDFYRRGFGWSQTVDVPAYAEFSTQGDLRVGLCHREGYVRNFTASRVSERPSEGVTAPSSISNAMTFRRRLGACSMQAR